METLTADKAPVTPSSRAGQVLQHTEVLIHVTQEIKKPSYVNGKQCPLYAAYFSCKGCGFPLSSLEQALKASYLHLWSILSFSSLCCRLGISASTEKPSCLSSWKENTAA